MMISDGCKLGSSIGANMVFHGGRASTFTDGISEVEALPLDFAEFGGVAGSAIRPAEYPPVGAGEPVVP
jgi:hypothetical protein